MSVIGIRQNKIAFNNDNDNSGHKHCTLSDTVINGLCVSHNDTHTHTKVFQKLNITYSKVTLQYINTGYIHNFVNNEQQ